MQTSENDDLQRFAEELFERLWAERIDLPRGEYGWLSVERDDRTGELILVAHDGIYSGQLGIAVYAAALHQVIGTQRYREVATDIADVYVPLERNERRPIGCSNGLASLAYGFATLGKLLDTDRYLDQARELTGWLVERIAHEDAPTDLLHGKAGALLVLLSIYEQTRSETILDRAHQVGTALVADAEQSPKTGWDLDTETGMAHGHAGIAYALYRLAAHSDQSKPFRQAADQAIAYENQYYSPAENRWTATPSDSAPRYAWCNGDGGIGAARAASLRYAESDTLRRDVQRVQSGFSWLSSDLPPNDSLCHGSFSVAVFGHACTVSGIDDLEHHVTDITRRVIARDRQHGHLQLPFRGRTDLLPTGLFNGIAGIGYMVLRAVAPDTLPSVALFE